MASVQPWIRDHYTAVRDGAAPRWNRTRAVVVPVVVDTTNRVRDDFLPAAAQFSSRIGNEAVIRSAPVRAEAMNRATAVVAAARGQVRAEQIAKERGNRRKLLFVLSSTAAGAAAGVAMVIWQRSRSQAWVEDDAVHSTLEGGHDEQASMPERSASASATEAADPSSPEGGTPTGKSRSEHHARH
jgi:hypothetical protein